MATIQTKSAPGTARCEGPSTRDIILKDEHKAPGVITEESYHYLGDEDVDYAAYYSEEVHRLEMDKMWPETWLFACREEHIPNPKDSHVFDVGDYSALIIRQNDGSIKAFINSCKHRGMQLQENGTSDSLKVIRCPFHGWTWGTDGKLMSIPCAWDFPHVDNAEYALDEIAVDIWGGFVFVNFSSSAPPLMDYLDVLPRQFAGWPMQNRHLVLHIQKTLPANWKMAQEAFLEAYHVLATHPQGLASAGDANAQYDIWGDHISRFVHTIGTRSPHLKGEGSEAEILKALGGDDLGLSLKNGDTARSVFSEHLRSTLGEAMGVDLSGVSTSEMIDSIEYHCFPNFMIFPGISLPMVYRFRPDGDNVDQSIFDLMFLSLTPEGTTPPKAPEPVKIGIETSYTEVEGMNPRLGNIYDQDTSNLARLTKGIKASRKKGQTLGNYQEVRIRQVRQTLDKYLSA